MKDIDTKEHYKMYKDGKKWVFASISVMSFLIMGAFSIENVHADVVVDSSTSSSEAASSASNLLGSSSEVVLPDKQASSAAQSTSETAQSNVTSASERDDVIASSETSSSAVNDESQTDTKEQPSSSVATDVSSVSDDKVQNNTSSTAVPQSAVASSETSSQASSANDYSATTAVSDATQNTVALSSAAASSSVSVVSDNDIVNSSENVSESDNHKASDANEQVKPNVTDTINMDNPAKEVVANNTSTADNKNLTKANSDNVPTVKATSSRHVATWDEFKNALNDSTINEIIIDNNLKDPTWGGGVDVASRPDNSLLIRSNDGARYAIDFQGSYPYPVSGKLNLTYENLDMYGTTYYGVVNSSRLDSATITFRNTSYTGAQLVYAGANTTVIFQGKNTVKTVDHYVSPVDGANVNVGSSQQGLEFTSDNDHIIFDVDSEFDGSTFKDNVIHMTGNNSTIEIKKGAVVTLTPHDNGDGAWGNAEHGWNANGIYMAGSGTLTVETGGTLKIDAGQDSKQGVAAISIIDANTTVNIEDGADVEISVNGNVMNSNSANTSVYINGQLNVGKNAKFIVTGHDMGSFAGTLVKISGNANITGSVFKIRLDDATGGTGKLTLLNVGNNVLIDNPKDFLLYKGNNNNAQWIGNGSFNLNVVRLQYNGTQTGPFKHVSFTGNGGAISVSSADRNKIVGLTKDDEDSLVSQLNELGSDANVNTLEFVQANDFVTIIDNTVNVINNEDGSKTIEGFTDTPGAYIHATSNGNEIIGNNLQSPYWQENTGLSKVIYAAQASTTKDPSGKGYKFSFTIPADVVNNLPAGATVDVYGTQNFVDSDTVSQDLGIISLDQVKDAINKAGSNAKEHINQLPNLTTEQRNQINSTIDNLVNAAVASDGSVDKAPNVNAANKIYNDIVDQLKDMTNLSDAKNKALAEVGQSEEDLINQINSNDSLTAADKTDLVNEVNAAADRAKANINNATTPETAQSAASDGVTAINDVSVAAKLQAAKNDANHALSDAAQTAIAAINGNDSLTADEKTDLVGQVNTAAEQAKETINNATTSETVQSAENVGETAINDVSDAVELQAAKNDANHALLDAVQTAVDAINGNTNLTADEKTDLVSQVNAAANQAKSNINNATTPETAQSAASDGETAINGVSEAAKLQAAKNDAVKQLDQVRNETIKQVKNSGLSAARQQELINEANAAHDEAVQKVNADTTIPAVNQDVEDGLVAITQVRATMTNESDQLHLAQNAAKNKLDSTVQDVIAAINGNDSLTADEKTDLVGQVNTAADQAKANINNATTPETAQSAASDGETAIEGVSEAAKLQAAKNDAVKQLDQARNNTIEQVKNSGLSAARQQALINEVNAAHDEAVQKVNADTTIPAVNQDAADGLAAISQVQATMTGESNQLHAAQNTAKNKLDSTVQDAIDAINGNDSLTADEKDDLVNQVNTAAEQAKETINNATTPETAQSAVSDGETAIEEVSEAAKLQAAKNDANQALSNAVQTAIAAINDNDSLTADEKTDLVGQVNTTADQAKANINNATTPETAQSAASDGVTAINDVSDEAKLQAAKNDANHTLAEATQNAIDAINGNDSLTADEKTDLVGEVNTAADQAKTNINNATTPETAQSAASDGETVIEEASEAAKLQAAKNDANHTLVEATQNAIDAINGNDSLTADEKADLISQVNAAANQAKANINNATTPETAQSAASDGETAIEGVSEA
ncbi:KxYKxGKxW signal peptide containing protein, partial [Weissella bombi]